jgi:hypothetical protein
VEGLQIAKELHPACRSTYMGLGRCVEIACSRPEVRLSRRNLRAHRGQVLAMAMADPPSSSP